MGLRTGGGGGGGRGRGGRREGGGWKSDRGRKEDGKGQVGSRLKGLYAQERKDEAIIHREVHELLHGV